MRTNDPQLAKALSPQTDLKDPAAALEGVAAEFKKWEARRVFAGFARSTAGRRDEQLREVLGDVAGENAVVLRLGEQAAEGAWLQFLIAGVLLTYATLKIRKARQPAKLPPELDVPGAGENKPRPPST